MNSIRPLLLLLALLAFRTVLFAQIMKTGLIYPSNAEYQDHCCVLFPVGKEINVYHKPEGPKAGKIFKTVEDRQMGNLNFKSYKLQFISNENDTINVLDIFAAIPINSDHMALTYYDRQKAYVQVMHNAGPYWINIKDLEAIGLTPYSLQDFMTMKSGNVLGFYPEISLNLRKAPSVTSEKIVTLSYLHEIELTGEHKGAWSKVKVIKLSQERCLGGEVIEGSELEGWIKAIDEECCSNIWYYVKGC